MHIQINIHAGLAVKINKLIANFAKKTLDGPVCGVHIHIALSHCIHLATLKLQSPDTFKNLTFNRLRRH